MQPELISDCVHCGFCLPSCPTYVLWHEEMDSPRGRIYLMQGLVDGSISLGDTVVEHFDRRKAGEAIERQNTPPA